MSGAGAESVTPSDPSGPPPLRSALAVLAATVIGIAAVMTVSWAVLGGFVPWPLTGPPETERAAAPRLQIDEHVDLARMRDEESAALNSAGYDTASGAARIPIDRAMALIAERGLPSRDSAWPAESAR